MQQKSTVNVTLRGVRTECIVVFPDGVGILPWRLCGTNSIGEATAKKMEEVRLVIWVSKAFTVRRRVSGKPKKHRN